MGEESHANKKSPLRRILENIGYIIPIGIVFGAGAWFQERQDSAVIDLLKERIVDYESRVDDTLDIEDFFANFDLAQMSSTGEHRLIFGTSSTTSHDSRFKDSIIAGISAIEDGKPAQAKIALNWVASELPGFPFTSFYLGVAEQSIMPRRAKPHFADAHAQFSFLLKIKPNNSVMRFYDAMSLTFLGLGDSATIQLYRVHKTNPEWRSFACGRLMLEYDTTNLSLEERGAWAGFVNGLREITCDTTILSSELTTVGRKSKIPTVNWPTGYDQLSP